MPPLSSSPPPSSPVSFSVSYDYLVSRLSSSDWRSHCLDYARLRVQLKKIAHQEKRRAPEASKSHQIFWSVCHSELDKVNSWLSLKVSEGENPLAEASDDDSIVFGRVLLEHQTEAARSLLPRPLFLSAQSSLQAAFRVSSDRPPPSSPPSDRLVYDKLHRFLALIRLCDELRRFALLNHWAAWKILKKYQQYTKKKDEAALSKILSERLVDGAALEILSNKISARLLKLIERNPESLFFRSCAFCGHLLFSPGIRLGCDHDACFPCFLNPKHFDSPICPVPDCGKKQTIESTEPINAFQSILSAIRTNAVKLEESARLFAQPAAKRQKVETPAFSGNPQPALAIKPSMAIVAPIQAQLALPGNLHMNSLALQVGLGLTNFPLAVPIPAKAVAVKESGKSSASSSHGSSCHQCKTAKPDSALMFCTVAADPINKKRRCRKKFCIQPCMSRFYHPSVSAHNGSWSCPSCLGLCACSACTRKSIKVATGNEATRVKDEPN